MVSSVLAESPQGEKKKEVGRLGTDVAAEKGHLARHNREMAIGGNVQKVRYEGRGGPIVDNNKEKERYPRKRSHLYQQKSGGPRWQGDHKRTDKKFPMAPGLAGHVMTSPTRSRKPAQK